MEAARAARAGRRENLSLRLAPLRARRKSKADVAFEGFYRKHVAAVYQYALAVLANPADAEDVTQQTFLNAYRAFQRGERPEKPHNWVIKIAHNVCRMRWRQSSRRLQEVPLELVPEPVALEGDDLSLDEVLAALARLPFNQRAAIVMREVEDRSYAEIAEVLGTTVPAVEALLFRARSSLRARRKALANALSIVPVPGSLSSFFGGGGGLVAAGGAVVGSEVALKVAALVAAGVVAGGIGFKAAQAIGTSVAEPAPALTAAQPRHAPLFTDPLSRLEQAAKPGTALAAFSHRGRALAGRGGIRSAPTTDRVSGGGPGAPAGDGAAAAPTASGSTVAGAAAETVNQVVASVPGLSTPSAPTVPTVPALPLPPPPPPPALPSLPTVTVTVPTLPLPPPPPGLP